MTVFLIVFLPGSDSETKLEINQFIGACFYYHQPFYQCVLNTPMLVFSWSELAEIYCVHTIPEVLCSLITPYISISTYHQHLPDSFCIGTVVYKMDRNGRNHTWVRLVGRGTHQANRPPQTSLFDILQGCWWIDHDQYFSFGFTSLYSNHNAPQYHTLLCRTPAWADPSTPVGTFRRSP